jgi:hypothetical protein
MVTTSMDVTDAVSETIFLGEDKIMVTEHVLWTDSDWGYSPKGCTWDKIKGAER